MIYANKRQLLNALIKTSDSVLDVGFLGENISREGVPNWPHDIIKKITSDVSGLDTSLPEKYQGDSHYLAADAEQFDFKRTFDVIFAGDLIEHLSNPGLFLSRCDAHLSQGGRLIITTPNAFNLFNMAEKITKREPTSNHDHTCYYNSKTIAGLLQKNGFRVDEVSFLYHLGFTHHESWKKKFLNFWYWLLSKFTDKFVETLVIVAKRASP